MPKKPKRKKTPVILNGEIVERLQPKMTVLRQLFLHSGNFCAYPECNTQLVDRDGDFMADVCHIEAAEVGGQRFNPSMTNEQRREFSNLILLCGAHHKKTNNEKLFPVSAMKEMKRAHEAKFSQPENLLVNKLKDWTKNNEPSLAKNLLKMNKVLKWGTKEEDLEDNVKELNEFILTIRRVPASSLQFAYSVAERANTIKDSNAVKRAGHLSPSLKIAISDLKAAFQIGDHELKRRIDALAGYGLGDVDEIDYGIGPVQAVALYSLDSGWPIWDSLVEFCEATGTPSECFTAELNFSVLDE